MSSARATPVREDEAHDSGSGDEDEDEELDELDPDLRAEGGGAGGDLDRRASGVGPSGGLGQAARDRKPVATRRRVVQSCSECRRRKIKCDKK